MKRFIVYLTFFLLFVVACNGEKSNYETPIEQQVFINEGAKPLDVALCDMYSVWEELFGGKTKVEVLPEIEAIEFFSPAYSKSNSPSQYSCKGVYLVNFKNGSGYSVLNANYGGSSIFALTEEGTIEKEALNEAMNGLLFGNTISDLKEDAFVYYYIASCILNNPTVVSVLTKDTPLNSTIVSTCSPLVTTKWGQSYPFNQSMPSASNSSTGIYRGKSPAGCGIIAAAQVIKYNEHPSFYSLTHQNKTWSQISGISEYYNVGRFYSNTFDTQASTSEKALTQSLAVCLRVLGDSFNAEYADYYTSVNASNVCTSLKLSDPIYYSDAEVVWANWHMFDLVNMLDSGKPTYFRGEQTLSSGEVEGHAWVVDGYIKKRDYYNWGYEEYYCLHFNWGWRGLHDGYYSTSSFLASDRVSYDGIIDSSYVESGDTDNYSEDLDFIKY